MAGENEAREFLRSYRFRVYSEDISMAFSKIKGLEQTVATEYFSAGGINSYGQLSILPSTSQSTLTLEHGILSKNPNGKSLRAGMYLAKGLQIIIMDEKRQMLKDYQVNGVTVTKWEVGEMDAASGGLLVETFEVVYKELK